VIESRTDDLLTERDSLSHIQIIAGLGGAWLIEVIAFHNHMSEANSRLFKDSACGSFAAVLTLKR